MNRLMLKKQYMYSYKKSRLPSSYQEVEYIQNTGTQYIDTNYYPNGNTSIEVEMYWTRNSNTIAWFWGCLDSNSIGFRTHLFYAGEAYGTYGTTNLSFTDTTSKNSIIALNGTRTYVGINENHALYYGNVVGSPIAYQSFNANKSLTIFAGNLGTLNIIARAWNMRVYKATIKESEAKVRELIPCYRKSDNVVGMYDLISRQFYTNQGSGTFLKGADVL